MTRTLPWFKLYHEARTDAKLRSLADDEFRVWFNLLCYASEQSKRGEIEGVTGRDTFLLALEVANGDEPLLIRTLHKLVRLRIIDLPDEDDEGPLSFINFAARNYEKPSDSPENTRERKARQRGKERDTNLNGSVVTPMSRAVTPSHAQEEKRVDKKRVEESRQSTPPTPSSETPISGNQNSSAAPTGVEPKYPPMFEEFWTCYPRKVGKDAALTAWKKRKVTLELHSQMLDAIAVQRDSLDWTKDGGDFIPHPATWINSAGWLNELRPRTATATPVASKPSDASRQIEYLKNKIERETRESNRDIEDRIDAAYSLATNAGG